jgi:hypothetical protein
MAMSPIVEILLYKLKPGTGREFFSMMRDVSVPLHRQFGIDVVWHGQSMHDLDGYGLIRAFADMASLEDLLSAFYSSETWRSGPREEIVSRIETATKIVIPMDADAIEGLRKQG